MPSRHRDVEALRALAQAPMIRLLGTLLSAVLDVCIARITALRVVERA